MQTISNPEFANAYSSKYFIYIAVLFVAVLMISNTIAVKIIQLGPLFISGATIIFPLSYIFGDILTEVYGYAASRRIIWLGFVVMILMALTYWIVQILPAAPFWQGQAAYESILGVVPRIVLASLIGYFIGEFCNSYVLSKMKIWTEGRHLWTRTISSTVVGEGVDSVLFATIAFAGIIPWPELWQLIGSIYAFKVAIEVIFTPLTYIIVNRLKRAEGMDVYDIGVDYNPFHIKA